MSGLDFCPFCSTGFTVRFETCPICRSPLGPRKRRGKRRIPQTRRRRIFKRDGGACVYCGSVAELTIDHVVPLAAGGSNKLANLQTLCRPCNEAKADTADRVAAHRLRRAGAS